MAAFETAFKKHGLLELHKRPKPEQAKPQDAATTSASASRKPAGKLDEAGHVERRFAPHQMAIRRADSGIVTGKRHQRNLLHHMADVKGPLAQLQAAVAQGRRIVVRTRSEHGLRGSLEGRLLHFDKHWNLLLAEAVETWRRRKYRYGENKICGVPEDCSERLLALGITLPAQQVRSVGRKNVEIRRQLGQLLVRGEQVALVVIPPDPGPPKPPPQEGES